MANKKLLDHFFSKKEVASMKAKQELLKENYFEEKQEIPDDVKERIMTSIKEYNKLGKQIYREGNLVDLAKNLSEIATFAEKYTIEGSADWFDGVTIQRNMKELKNFSGEFGKVAEAVQQHQDRMSSLYEDMGHILNRYFEIASMAEEQPTMTSNADASLYQGDRAQVNMNMVRKNNPTPRHIKQVRHEISKGNGTVKIYEINDSVAVVGGGDINLYEVEIPTSSLTKVIGRISEVAKFDKSKMQKFVKSDKFLGVQAKTNSLEDVFNKFVLGDAKQEREYNKVK